MTKGKKLYEGKAKIIYSTSDKNLVIQYFKDDATAFNNEKRTTIEGKGVLNNRISEHILTNLSQIGIENHLVKRLNMREQLIKFVEIIPTDKKLDKDRFRKDLGDLLPAYTEVAKRLGILHEQSNVSAVNVTKLSSIKKKRK